MRERKSKADFDPRLISERLATLPFDDEEEQQDLERFLDGRPTNIDLHGLFFPGEFKNELAEIRDELRSRLRVDSLDSCRDGMAKLAKQEIMATELPVNDKPYNIGVTNFKVSHEDVVRYSAHRVLHSTVQEGSFYGENFCEYLQKILKNEDLLRIFLLPWNSRLVLTDVHKVALQLTQDGNEAKRFCASLFKDNVVSYVVGMHGERDESLYIYLHKYAVLYFRTKYAMMHLAKVKKLLQRFIPAIGDIDIQFDFQQRNKSCEWQGGQTSGNNGFMQRIGKRKFVITINCEDTLSLDDTKTANDQNCNYSGGEKDFITILHEFLHIIYDMLVDPENELSQIEQRGISGSAYYTMSEGFASTGELLMLRAIIEDRQHLDLGEGAEAEVFEPIIQTRLAFVQQMGLHTDGMKIMTYLLLKYGEKIFDFLAKIDPKKARLLSTGNSTFYKSVQNENFEKLFAEIIKSEI